MGAISGIAWCGPTFNPWIGCCHVHTGCLNCYAEAEFGEARRKRVIWKSGEKGGTRSRTTDSYWRQPRQWNALAKKGICLDCSGKRYVTKRKGKDKVKEDCPGCGATGRLRPFGNLVFCSSLADVFEEYAGDIVDHEQRRLWTPRERDPEKQSRYYHPETEHGDYRGMRPATLDDLRDDLFKLIDSTRYLTWLVLTKRPERIWDEWSARRPVAKSSRIGTSTHYYRPNVWLGTSISDQNTANKYAAELAGVDDVEKWEICPVKFLSYEPATGPVDFGLIPGYPLGVYREAAVVTERMMRFDNKGKPAVSRSYQRPGGGLKKWTGSKPEIQWVIVGGESGPNARLCREDWVRSTVEQCKSAGVACFVKQMGANNDIETNQLKPLCKGLDHPKGGDPYEWEPDLRIREFPKIEPSDRLAAV